MQSGRVLLCRRAIEPRIGFWTPPGGFQEIDESTREAALRESMEEACAKVRIEGLLALLDIEHLGQTYCIYRGVLEGEHAAGSESQETRLFDLDAIPWDEMAFPVLTLALRWFVEEHRQGQHCVHTGTVAWDGSESRWDVSNYFVKNHLRQVLAP